MRIPAARRRSRPLALLLVLLMLAGTNSAWHAPDDDDDALPVRHDHSAHRMRSHTPTSTTPPTHCALCHWLTALRIASPARVTIAFALTGIAAPRITTVHRTN